jgi:Spy/CpxP family protein refolding chaperone
MKAFRIAALGVALLAGSAAIAGAQAAAPGAPQQQGGPGGPGGGRGGIGRILTGITLTDAQQAKFTEIQAKYQPQLTAIRQSFQNGGDRADGMKKMNEINDKLYPELRAVLTPEQQTVFDKNVAERKARMEQMRQGGGAGR